MKRLIRNTLIVSVDPEVGNIDNGDLLIENGQIVAIGQNLDATADEVIDGSHFITSPGFVDAHHHLWQSAMRSLTGDWSLQDYVFGIRMVAGSYYRPQDMFAANWHGALEAIHAGVTTVADYCHNLITPDHAEEAVRGVRESGIRAVWCYGFNSPPTASDGFRSVEARIDHLKSFAVRHFASRDGLVTLGFCPEERGWWPDNAYGKSQLAAAHDVDARIYMHGNTTVLPSGEFERDVAALHDIGFLDDRLTLVHMAFTDPDEWQMMADAGAAVVFTPETEAQMGMFAPSIETVQKHRIPFGFGIDIVSNNSADLRLQVRMGLQFERLRLWQEGKACGLAKSGAFSTSAEALEWATMGGARANGLDHLVGSLSPGKRADILLHDLRSVGLVGIDRRAPEKALMLHAGPDSLAHVLVDGEFRKRDFEVVGAAAARNAMLGSSDRIFARINDAGGAEGLVAQGMATFTNVPTAAEHTFS